MVMDWAEDAENRRSDDCPETTGYLNGLIQGGKISINDVLKFFNYACGAYKQACIKTGMTDSKINIEFNYAARAFAAYLSDDDNETNKSLAVLDAFQASRHIINDSLDIILGEIERLIGQAENISELRSLDGEIHNYDEMFEKKEEIHKIVASSRRKRGTFRYEQYLKIIEGEAYNELLIFLKEIKKGIEKLLKIRRKEQKQNRRNLNYVLIPLIISIVIGIFPDEAKQIGNSIKDGCQNMKDYFIKNNH